MTETLAPVRPGKLIINGEAVDAASGRTFTTRNPATEEPICAVAEAGPEDVDRAVAAARAAFEGPWAKLKPAERQRLLWTLADLIEKNADEIARLETLDNGKPIFESRWSTFRWSSIASATSRAGRRSSRARRCRSAPRSSTTRCASRSASSARSSRGTSR
jgi:acyl-CoA reductase-like NAD-dependent aldehyde dehydrogenase